MPSLGSEHDITENKTFQKSHGGIVSSRSFEFTYKEAIEACGYGWYQRIVFCVTGWIWAADAIEIMLLGFLIPELKDEWDLSDFEAGSVGAAVFFGMMLGAFTFASLSDRLGRRTACLGSILCCTIFGILTAIAPNVWWVIVFRTGVGFGLGGSSVAFILFTELVPQSARANAVLLQNFFWAFGSIFSVGLAWVFLPCCGWRYFVGACSAPLVILLCFSLKIPESPRFLLTTGDIAGATEALRAIARKNGKSLPQGNLKPSQSTSHGKLRKIFLPHYRKTSIAVLFLFWCQTFCYYGICFLSISTFGGDEDRDGDDANHDRYWQTFVTTLSEVPGIFAGMVLLDRIGRKNTILSCWVAFCICGLVLSVSHLRDGQAVTVTFIFFARACCALGFLTVYVYFSEYYPTPIRNTALGFASSLGRIAAMTVTFGVETLKANTVYGLITGVGFAAFLATTTISDTTDKDQTDILVDDDSEMLIRKEVLPESPTASQSFNVDNSVSEA